MWELQQTRDLATAQLISDEGIAKVTKNLALMGENPAPTIVKGCTDPRSLTLEELFVYQRYLRIVVDEDERRQKIEQVSGIPMGYRDRLEGSVSGVLGTKVGRLWYEEGRELWVPEPLAVADKLIEAGPIVNCNVQMLGILELVHSEEDPRDN
ncbi:MAG: hypothetical protein ACI9ON_002348 [Limisphaerales bacterium]|jgi:hypothetical protein